MGQESAGSDKPLNTRGAELYEVATWTFLGLSAVFVLGLRIYIAWDLPLWLDESWTAVLSAAPTLQSFVHQMWLDSNAPLYYFLMWLWPVETSFGLKIPSIVFMVASSCIAYFFRPVERKQALFWGVLLVLWWPGMSMLIDARYYALLYLLSTAQTIAYVRLLTDPTLKRAFWWTGFATLAVLTHYFSAVLALVQGLYYLSRHRERALQTWPAVLLTAPSFAWTAYHWPRLRLYAMPDVSWYEKIGPAEAVEFLLWPLGGGLLGLGLLGLAALFLCREPISRPVLAVSLTGLVSAVFLLCLATFYPIFSPRYLLPMAPPILLGIAVAAQPVGYLPIAAWLFISTCSISGWSQALQAMRNFGLEKPAGLIADGSTVTWMIDYGAARIHDREQMEAMLVDAFARNGRQLKRARWGTDFEAGDALLLIYHSARGRRIPTPDWPCASRSGHGHTVIVCNRNRRSVIK